MANEAAIADHKLTTGFPAPDDWDGWMDLLGREDDGTIECVPEVMRSEQLLSYLGTDGRLSEPDMVPSTPYGVAKFLSCYRVELPWSRREPRPATAREVEAMEAEATASAPMEQAKPVGPLVYMIRSGDGPIKIGLSNDPEKRLKGLQTAHPYRLTLLCTMPGGSELESYYHSRFAAHRLHGEWFSPHPDILAEIERLK